jgi:lysophospholipase L1-like esterase
MRNIKLLLVLLLPISINNMVKAQTIAPFKAGDKVAFVGNSITDGGHYHSDIWLYYMTRFPNQRITCYNVGIGGDNVKQMYDRFDYEVLPKHPTIMTLTWGMNDSGYFEWFKPDAASYAKNTVDTAEARYAKFDAELKLHPEIKKIFILGSPYDATTKSNPKNYYPGKTDAFQKLIDFQEETAKKNGWGFVDFDHPMMEINKREQATDTSFSLTPNDRIHPDNAGHLVMAYLFLKSQGLAGKPVADFDLNAKNKKVTRAINCSITNIGGTDENISFDYLAYALPFPVDTTVRGWGQKTRASDALNWIPFTKDMNQEILRVKGLKDGNYKLIMDGQEIGQWSSKEISDGINLAEQSYTPEYQQAIAIRDLNEDRWEIERRTRQYQFVEFNLLKQKGLLNADNKAAMDTVIATSKKNPFINGDKDVYAEGQFKAVREAWQKEQDALVDEIYTVNKPSTHRVTLAIIK